MIALYAFAAMLVQDVTGVLLTQAEARDRAVLAGTLDLVGWLVALLTLNWSLNAVNGHNLGLKIAVIGAVSAANFIGSYAGTKLGKRFVKNKSVEDRLATIETHLGLLEGET